MVEYFFNTDEHKYYDSNNNTYTSITQLLSQVGKPFNSRYWAMYVYIDKQRKYKIYPKEKLNVINIDGKDYNVETLYKAVNREAIEEITDLWFDIADEACTFGDKIHNKLESLIESAYKAKYVGGKNYNAIKSGVLYERKFVNISEIDKDEFINLSPKIYDYVIFLLERGWTLYAECRVYNSKFLIASTIDLLAVKDNYFRIIDWKTNKDELKFKSGYYKKKWIDGEKVKTDEWVDTNETFKAPIDHVPYCKGNIYNLQLSGYAYLIEVTLGLVFNGLELFHLRSKITKTTVDGKVIRKRQILDTFYYNLPYMKTESEALFFWHKCNNTRSSRIKAAR